MRLELVEVRKAADFQNRLHDTLKNVVSQTIRNVHTEAVNRAPVDTGRLRNNMIWCLDGNVYGGANAFETTAPESPWGHKPGARPVGAPADQEDPNNLKKFRLNKNPNKVIGYVANNVKRDGHAPYGVYQEFGWTDKSKHVHVQPYFRPAVYIYGVDPVVRPTFLRALKSMEPGPMKIERIKK